MTQPKPWSPEPQGPIINREPGNTAGDVQGALQGESIPAHYQSTRETEMPGEIQADNGICFYAAVKQGLTRLGVGEDTEEETWRIWRH